VGESIDTAQHAVASVDREFDFFASHFRFPFALPSS
jgi:hypothetical protein